jgi:hypothetical protein
VRGQHNSLHADVIEREKETERGRGRKRKRE